MTADPTTGRIILIHGPSSSGKSTLARAVQSRIATPFWHWSIDHLRESGTLPMARIQSGEFAWPDLRPAFFEGFHRSLAAFARSGNDLIVEHIVETEAFMNRLIDGLEGLDVFVVELGCPLSELERRERERGDRRIGEARADWERTPVLDECDLALDATRAPEQNAATLISAWRERRRPNAFERIAGRA